MSNSNYNIPIGGPNLTCSLLWHHLCQIRENPQRRSKHLQIQMDNCPGENKNRTVFAFCGMLVHKKIYESVTLSFLIPGHTHDDIDQMFSTWSQHYWRNNLYTLDHIPEFVNQAYTDPTKRPTTYNLSWLYDFKSWLENLHTLTHYSKQR